MVYSREEFNVLINYSEKEINLDLEDLGKELLYKMYKNSKCINYLDFLRTCLLKNLLRQKGD